jgi:hypothetical protein
MNSVSLMVSLDRFCAVSNFQRVVEVVFDETVANLRLDLDFKIWHFLKCKRC